MAANRYPIATRTPDVQVGGAVLGPSANTVLDGTGANVTAIYRADATEGGYVREVRLKPVASPAATVARVFFCTEAGGTFTPGTTNTAANSALLAEHALPAFTVSQTAATPDFVIPIMQALPPGTRLFITFGTSTGASGTGYAVSVWGGKY